MKLRPTILIGLVLFVAFFSANAFAQSPAPTPVQAPISWVFVITTIIAFVAGLIGQAVQTGSLFGKATIPQTWIPILTLAGSFLGAFGVSLKTSGSLDSTSILYALMAGMTALGSAAAGTAAHTHINARKMFRKAAATAPVEITTKS